MTTLSIRLDDETCSRLEALAESTERSKTHLLKRALLQYLEANEWQVAEIQRGVAEADAGELIDHEDVRRTWEAKLANPVDPNRRG
jgi:RHH-type rel operon transcriptional repressor/antitoxin RelB